MNAPKKTREEIAKAYVSDPWWYDLRGLIILELSYRTSLHEQVVFFSKNMKNQHLEAAVGSGSLLQLFLWWRKWKRLPAVNITGFDYAESMLAGAMKRFPVSTGINLHLVDVAEMDYPSNHFDSINIANAFHCFPDIDGALRELFRVLKPGGTLAINVLLFPRAGLPHCRQLAKVINDWGIRKGILVTPYEKDDVRGHFAKAGFVIDWEKVIGNCYYVIIHKP